jgi:AcrR family transcriptional regulator
MIAMSAAKASTQSGRERLLEACDKLFSDASYSEVGVAAILEEAGVQAPTLYHHFSDKEGLFVAWAEAAFKRLGAHIRASGATTLDGLGRVIWGALDFDLQQVVRDANRLSRGDSKEKVVTAYFEAVYEPLVSELVRKTSVGEMRAEPMGRLVDAFLGGLLALRRQSPHDEGEIARWWAGIFERGLATGG